VTHPLLTQFPLYRTSSHPDFSRHHQQLYLTLHVLVSLPFFHRLDDFPTALATPFTSIK
jgi:hypothetical protein